MIVAKEVHHTVHKEIQHLTRQSCSVFFCLSPGLLIADHDISYQSFSFVIQQVLEKIVMSFKLRKAQNICNAVLFSVLAVELEYFAVINYSYAEFRLILKLDILKLAEFRPECYICGPFHEIPHLRRQLIKFIIEYYLHISPVADFITL